MTFLVFAGGQASASVSLN